MSDANLCPAFHGTAHRNHRLIFQDGLLIPGQGNNLEVVNGSAHGLGIYTARLNAAWLSGCFCDDPSLLVCAVLQSKAVRHVMDAMVVFNAASVVPLFVGRGKDRVARASGQFALVNMSVPRPVRVSQLLSPIPTQPSQVEPEPVDVTPGEIRRRGPLGGAGSRPGIKTLKRRGHGR